MENGAQAFDFGEHERTAVAEYLKVRPFYEDLARAVARIIEECSRDHRIKVHSVQHRAKDPTSFGRKASIPSEGDPSLPKYRRPLDEITDLAGVRVITHFPGTLSDIDKLLHDEFEVLEHSDKSKELIEDERFGYRSVHYLVRIKAQRAALAEYSRFRHSVAEVQVRTLLQHAWAEIEHDIQYKSASAIPTEIRRRFMALAGMPEIADREFQAIQDADRKLARETQRLVERGELTNVEITPHALKAFPDRRLGQDGRIADWTYDWTARERLCFRMREPTSFNLHVARRDGPHWRSNVALRDYLRCDEMVRRRYAQAKRAALAGGKTTLLTYSTAKAAVIAELLRLAGETRNRCGE